MNISPPVLPAYPTPHGWKVWCNYCRRWHQHGAQPGHRVAHCRVPSSPYRTTGYILKLAEETS
jgi:hypothetical protein